MSEIVISKTGSNRGSQKIYQVLYLIFRLIISAVFLWAGIAKLMDPKAFGQIISQYRIVPEFFLPVIAIGLPVIEVFAGIALVFDKRFSLTVITIMLFCFIAILWFGILKNLEIDCGCFSASEQNYHDGLKTAFKRDWILLSMAAFLYFYRVRFQNRFYL